MLARAAAAAVLVAAAAAQPLPPVPPAATCAAVLYSNCWQHKATAAQCAACELTNRPALQAANCTTALEAAFCAIPSQDCAEALAFTCGPALLENSTACQKCTGDNAAGALKMCSKTTISAFCAVPLPPVNPVVPAGILAAECAYKLLPACNHTIGDADACKACEAANKDALANCAPAELADFCQAPSLACVEALALTCGARTWQNASTCKECTDANADGALKNCSKMAEAAFCYAGGLLPPEPDVARCGLKLESVCNQTIGDADACAACEAAHKDELDAAYCMPTELADFCKIPLPEARCAMKLLPACNYSIGKQDVCTACEAAHKDELDAAGCSAAMLADFCEAPGVSCLEALGITCGVPMLENMTTCKQCTADNAAGALQNCTPQALSAFCAAVNVLPPLPPGAATCAAALIPVCNKTVGQADACAACEADNKDALDTAGCTATELADFCAIPAPAAECLLVLVPACNQTIGQVDACAACEAANKDALDAANCTDTVLTDFCQVPGASCAEKLALTCGMAAFDGPESCQNCTAANKDGALQNCSAATLAAFCLVPLPPLPPIIPSILPAAECVYKLVPACNHTIGQQDACKACELANKDILAAANCTAAELADFCEVPGVSCAEKLALTCAEAKVEGADSCQNCTAAHAAALQNCSAQALSAFCAVPLPPLPPIVPKIIPEAECAYRLVPACNHTIGDGDACAACEAANKAALDAAGCTAAELADFCGAPGESCIEAFGLACGATKLSGDVAKCEACAAANAAKLAAAGCTAAQAKYAKFFCDTTLPPAPPPPAKDRYHCDTTATPPRCVKATSGHSTMDKCKEACA